MDRYEFHRTLKLLARAAALRGTELAVWFEHPTATVFAWANNKRRPGDVIWPSVWERAQLLHKAIYKYAFFPTPSSVHFSQRKSYVQQRLADALSPVPKGPTARSRVEMRLGTRARRIEAPKVGGIR